MGDLRVRLFTFFSKPFCLFVLAARIPSPVNLSADPRRGETWVADFRYVCLGFGIVFS
jgi:hypothetical protein